MFLLKWHYITFYTNNSGAHQFKKKKKKNLPPSQTSLITWECLTATTAQMSTTLYQAQQYFLLERSVQLFFLARLYKWMVYLLKILKF